MSEAELIEIEQRMRRLLEMTEEMRCMVKRYSGDLVFGALIEGPWIRWAQRQNDVLADLQALVGIQRKSKLKVMTVGGGK